MNNVPIIKIPMRSVIYMGLEKIISMIVLIEIILFGTIKTTIAQEKIEYRKLSLNDAIELAKENSFDYKAIEIQYKNSYWDYQNSKSQFLPKLTLSSTIPGYSQSVTQITLPDGSGSFVSQNQASSNLSLNVNELIALTGGSISASSNLNRLDLFGNNKSLSYNSAPLSFSYNQSSFTYNRYKEQKKIEELSFEESKKIVIEGIENISSTTVNNYFNALLAQIKLRNATQDYKNADSLYGFSREAYSLGKIRESEFIQSQINLLKEKTTLSEAKTTFYLDCKELLSYLNLDVNINLELEIPDSLFFFSISLEKALEEAQSNSSKTLGFRQRELLSKDQLASVKSNNGISVSLNSNIGFSQVGNSLKKVYANLNNEQSLSATLSMPILDWGSARNAIKKAQENVYLEDLKIKKEEVESENEIFQQVSNWNLQKNKIEIARRTSKLAERGFDVAKEEFFLGKISFLELSQAQQAKNDETVNYINALGNYWISYYAIRKLTLFDFENNRKIDVNGAIKNIRF